MTLDQLKSQMTMLRNQRARVQENVATEQLRRAKLYRELLAADISIANLQEIAADLTAQMAEANRQIIEIETTAQPANTTKFDQCSPAYRDFIRSIIQLGEQGFVPKTDSIRDRCEVMRKGGALYLVKRPGGLDSYYVGPDYLPAGVKPVNPVGMPAGVKPVNPVGMPSSSCNASL